MDFFVLADDLTGALDIAVSDRVYKEHVDIVFGKGNIEFKGCDLIIDTETREEPEEIAYNKIREISELAIKKINSRFIYKKVDSVLRGNVSLEIKAMDDIYNFEYIVIDIAYPMLNRVVNKGNVFIDGKLLQDTDLFFEMKENGDMQDFLKNLKKYFYGQVQCLNSNEKIKERILFFDTTKNSEFLEIIDKIDLLSDNVLWVGSMGLFNALIKKNCHPHLVLCIIGSVSELSFEQIYAAKSNNIVLVKIESELSVLNYEYYVNRIRRILSERKNVILYSQKVHTNNHNVIETVNDMIGKIASEIVDKVEGINFFLSGGATAMNFVSRRNVTSIEILGELEKSVPIIKIKENKKIYVIAMKSGRVGKKESLKKYIESLNEYIIP